MATLFDPHYQAMDANGAPLAGALLYFYLAGTTTETTIYQDADQATPHTNPVVADSAGLFAPIFVVASTSLKVVLKTSTDVTVQSIDEVDPSGGLVSIVAGDGIELDVTDPRSPIVSFSKELSTDGTLAGDSDDAVPTEKAVKTYVDSRQNGGTQNPILNGDMVIRQNPSSVAAATDGTRVPDHWTYNKIGAVVHTVAESSNVPTVAQAGRLFTKSIHLALTTGDDSVGAGDEVVLVQKIEGARFRAIAQQEQNVGFWWSPPVTGTYYLSFRNDVPDLSCVVPIVVTAANIWQWSEAVMPATPAAGTWIYDNSGAGLRVGLVIMAGANFLAPSPSVWHSGYYHACAGNVNGGQTGATNLYMTGFDMWPVDSPPNQPRSFEEELALCTRIRRRYTGLPDNSMVLQGVALSSTSAQFIVHGMRPINAVTYGGTPEIRVEGVGSAAVTSMDVVAGSVEGVSNIIVGASGLTEGGAVTLTMSGTADWIDISGEF